MILKPHLVNTMFLAGPQQWTAFVTWNGYDFNEIGETERNAIHFLLTRHAEDFGLTSIDIDNYTIKILALNRQR